MNKNFHINADVGEGFGIEAEIIPLIDSCNIACGGHAGGKMELSKAITIAKKNDVKIGAHPSYPDIDRRYHDNGKLVSRTNPFATLSSLEDLNQQFYTLINHQYVKTLEGNPLSLKVDTLCIHGDHPDAVRNLKSLIIKFKKQ